MEAPDVPAVKKLDAPDELPRPEHAPPSGAYVPELETDDEHLIDALPRRVDREVLLHEHGFVRLVDAMPRLVQRNGLGPEAAVVQAARVSYGAGTKTAQTDQNLLRYLFRHAHLTPFEMITLKFCVRAPLFTARQWMRHRSGAFNEESARYSVIAPEFYVPDEDEVCAQSSTNRQGSGAPLPEDTAREFQKEVGGAYTKDRVVYETALENGVAREMARIVLPEGRFTTFYWAVNLRNLFGFLELRLAPDAQDSIRGYAHAILAILRLYCPLAVEAFNDYRLHAVTLTALEIVALRSGAIPAEMSKREAAEWERKRQQLE